MAAAQNRPSIGVIDIFAGPGGLGEGFSTFTTDAGHKPFEILVSAEKEGSAHATLQLRAFTRLLAHNEGEDCMAYRQYLETVAHGIYAPPSIHFGEGRWKSLWKQAEDHARQLTLGEKEHNAILYQKVRSAKKSFDELVLIGGPPCQAYSLVGRARNNGIHGYVAEKDTRHFLYRQYLQILSEFKPAVFILENVKGILTSKVGKERMFPAILRDLSSPKQALDGPASSLGDCDRYDLLPVHIDLDAGQERTPELAEQDPNNFLIRCENHGIAQARHRVVIMGVRRDFTYTGMARQPGLNTNKPRISVQQALADLPPLRSGLSRRPDDPKEWFDAVEGHRKNLATILTGNFNDVVTELRKMHPAFNLPRHAHRYTHKPNDFVRQLRQTWQKDVLNHDTRGHMPSDLGRYLFCAAFAKVRRYSPNSRDFPTGLAPSHKNWTTGAFADRFRVQVDDEPSTTVTSHLSKDGHAFIHWDPEQCRSLTVREAARLQSFPDDYLFLGNRTQQYVQVGNAVPPLVAQQIAKVVWQVLDGKP